MMMMMMTFQVRGASRTHETWGGLCICDHLLGAAAASGAGNASAFRTASPTAVGHPSFLPPSSSPFQVNAWHWVEKDALPWAKARLGELLVGKTLVEGGGLAARVTKLKSATGDCIVNNRKQKVIAA